MNNEQQGVLYLTGSRGYSAYEIAVQNGYVGTEEEWLASLKGDKGDPGTPFDELTEEQKAEIKGDRGYSSYEIAVQHGYIGTEQDFINNFLTPEGYYNKDTIDDKLNDEAEFIFPKFWSNAISGDASLIKYKNKVIMIDCYYEDMWDNVEEMLNLHNVSHIDYFICTHYHKDHIENFENLIQEGYIDSTTQLYMPAETTNFGWQTSITQYKNICQSNNLDYYVPSENETLTINNLKLTFTNCDAEALDAYYPSSLNSQNATSTIVLIEHKNNKILYTGDADNMSYQRLIELDFVKGKVDLFKIGHHGINITTNEEFLQNISPTYAVQPGGIVDFSKNNFGNCPMTKYLNELGTKIYPCFMQNDYITFVSDGYNVHCEKGVPYTVSNYYERTNTIYVNINASNSNIQDGSQEHPFHELMQAIGTIKNNPYNVVTIQLSNGDYNLSHEDSSSIKNSTFIQFSDNKKIVINGDSSDRTKVTLNGVIIRNSSVTLQNLTSYADKRSGLECYNSNVTLQNVLITSNIQVEEGETYPYNGIFASGSNVYIVDSKIDKVHNPLLANDGSNVITNNLTFGTNTGTNNLPVNRDIAIKDIDTKYDNVDDRFSDLKHYDSFIRPLILYKDATSDYTIIEAQMPIDITKLSAIEIFVRNRLGRYVSSGIIYYPTNDYTIPLIITDASTTHTYIQTCNIVIEDDTLRITNQKQIAIKDSDGSVTVTVPETFKIRRIVGYVNNLNYVDLSN